MSRSFGGASPSPAPRTEYPAPVRPRRRRSRIGALLTLGMIGAGTWLAWTATHNPFGDRTNLTLLVLGTDEEFHGRSRSDTILVSDLRLAPDFAARVAAIPRDTRVTVPGHGRHRINAAYAFGGTALTGETLRRNFGVEVDRSLVVTPESMARLVDAAGGITLDVAKPMHYEDRAQHLRIDLQPGRQHLNGEQAVHYVRWRSDGLGDLGRVTRQREFLRTLASQALRPANCWRWPVMAYRLQHEVKTDLSLRETVYLGAKAIRSGPEALQPRKVPYRVTGPYVRIRRTALHDALYL